MGSQVQEQWHVTDQSGLVEANTRAETIGRRVSRGTMTTRLKSSRGRTIALVSDGSRAMVMLLEPRDGDPGEHAVLAGRSAPLSG